jgi:hypothetical protein
MEQERSTRLGAGTRLAAPALRARRRVSGGQATLDFNEPAWDGPVPEIAPDDRGSYWPRSAAAAASLPWRATLGSLSWGAKLESLPWTAILTMLRRASVIGAMGAAGFALVLYGARPHKADKHAAVPVQSSIADGKPAGDASPAPQPAPAPAEMAGAPAAHWGVDPLAPVDTTASVPRSDTARSAQQAAVVAAPSSTATPSATLAETPTPQLLPRTAGRHRAVASLPATAHAPHARPIARAAIHTVAAPHAAPRGSHRAVAVAHALPGWLTQPHRAAPAPLVMSEPPHSLSLPVGRAPTPARVVAWRLPPLRAPAAPVAPAYAPAASGIYYGAGAVPPPQPDGDGSR